MELILLNSTFERLHEIDAFDSLIWTDRYWESGDFEVKTIPSTNIFQALSETVYIKLRESEHLMFLEIFDLHSDIEEGYSLILKGRSLETILSRRIIWDLTTLTGNLQTGIEQLLDDSIISPTDTDRTISNFTFLTSTDPAITALTIDTQFVGDTVYDAISAICQSREIGFKVVLTSSGNFEFSLYSGVDRSSGQSTNPLIVFSADNDSLLNSDYLETGQYEKTVALVAGEKGVGNIRRTVTVAAPGGSLTGLARKEIYIDAGDISRNTPAGDLTDIEYDAQLEGRGIEELAKNIYIQAFDGQIGPTEFVYGDDFLMGDVLHVADAYGHEADSRVTEITYSQDNSGSSIYPTFTTIV